MQINAVFFLELISQELNQTQVKILTPEEGIPVGRQHFKLMLTVDLSDLDN